MPQQQATIETVLDAVMLAISGKMTWGGAIGTVISWVFSSQFGVFAGVVIGGSGLLINWYYRAKQDRREQAEHEKRMAEK